MSEGFVTGLLGGATSVMRLYGMYQDTQKSKIELDDAKAAGEAAKEQIDQGKSGGDNSSSYTPIDTTDKSSAPAPAPKSNDDDVFDPDAMPGGKGAKTTPVKSSGPALDPETRARIMASASSQSTPAALAVSPTGGLGRSMPDAVSPPVGQPPPPDVAGRADRERQGYTQPYSAQGMTQGAALPSAAVNAPANVPTAGQSAQMATPSTMPTYDVPSSQMGAFSSGQGTPQADAAQAQQQQPALNTQAPPIGGYPPHGPAGSAIMDSGMRPSAEPPVPSSNGEQFAPDSAAPGTLGPQQQTSLGGKILGALNPIGSAQAGTIPPGGLTSDQLTSARGGAGPDSALPQQGTSPVAAAIPVTDKPAVAPPAGEALPQEKAGATVSVPASQAPVAPGQTTPTTQSEASTPQPRPLLDPRYYGALKGSYKAMVDQVASEEGVPPEQLALHWHLESSFAKTAPDGKDGEKGVMQTMPATMRMVDPRGELDPSKLEDSLRLGARYIHVLNTSYGTASPDAVLAYQQGPGNVSKYKGMSMDELAKVAPNGARYLQRAYGGQDTPLSGQHFSMDPVALYSAGQKGGPDGVLHYLAQTGSPNMPLGEKWQAAAIAGAAHAALRGDQAGVQHAQDYILQMMQQGSTTSLMNAYKALSMGDGVTASQQLARAHAFFPDNTMGRFGTDDKGNVWAQRVDEANPSVPIGKSFQVTPQGLQSMFMQTRDPTKFMGMIQEQQRTAAQIKQAEALDRYRMATLGLTAQSRSDNLMFHQDQLKSLNLDRGERTLDRRDRLDANNQYRSDMVEVARQRLLGQLDKQQADPAAPKTQAVDSEVSKIFTADNPDLTTMSPEGHQVPFSSEQRGAAAQIYSDLRHQSGTGNHISGPQAQVYAKGVGSGQMSLYPGKGGTYGIFHIGDDPKSTAPLAEISKSTAESIARMIPGSRNVRPNGQGQPPRSPYPPSALPQAQQDTGPVLQ